MRYVDPTIAPADWCDNGPGISEQRLRATTGMRNLTSEAKYSLLSVIRLIEGGSVKTSDISEELNKLAEITAKQPRIKSNDK